MPNITGDQLTFNIDSISDNQILVYDGSSGIFVAQDSLSSNANAAVASASNVGASGVGVFKEKDGSVLKFKNIAPGTNTTVTEDVANGLIKVNATQYSPTAPFQLHNNNGNVFVAQGQNYGANANVAGFIGVQSSNSYGTYSDSTTFDGHTRFRLGSNDLVDVELTSAHGLILSTAQNSDGHIQLRSNTNIEFYAQGSLTTNPDLEITGAGALKIGNSFTMPTADGTSDQVLSTYGNGVVHWKTITVPSFTESSILAKTVRLDQTSVPTVTNSYDIGSTTRQFYEVHANYFKGQADTAIQIYNNTNGTVLDDSYILGLATNSSNLSGLTDAGVARTNLGVYSKAEANALVSGATQTNSFVRLTDGTNTASAANTNDVFTITGGNDITATINAGTKTLTIDSTATPQNAFKHVFVSGQNTISADSSADGLTFAAGSGIQITTDEGTDTITITNSGGGGGGGATEAFKNIAVSGQTTIVADASADTVTFVAGTGMTITTDDANDSVTFNSSGSFTTSDVDAHLNQSNPTSGYVLSWNGSDYAWVSNAGYTDADVDTHLNQSGASASQVLSWNGSDYAWVAQSGGVALTDLSVTTASASGGGTLAYNNSTGAFTFAPADLTGYQTTAGLDAGINTHLNQSTAASGEVLSWNGSDYDWIAQTDAQALTYDSGTGNLSISGGNTVDLSSLLDNVDAQVLSISGNTISLTGQSGNVDLTSLLVAGNYDNADVDAHLNQSNPTSGYVLSWNGSDYAWVAQSGGGGSMSDVVDDTSPQLGGALDVNGQDIVSTSNGDIDLDPNGSGVVVFKGNATKGAGQFKLNCENNSHGITIKGPPHSAAASYTLTLPNNDGDADQVLKTDGSGGLSWVDQSGGGGGSVTRATHWEEFRVDYDSGDNSVSGNANVSAGISSIIFSGYDATIDFTGYDQPPLSIVLYGYDAQNNKYYVTHCDQNNRAQVAGNGSAGSPTAFTDFSSTTITVNVNLTNTGGQRDPGGFGQPAVASHTWVRFIMGD